MKISLKKNNIEVKGISRSLIFLILVNSVFTASSQVGFSPKAPLMGWSSWNNFSVNINESTILRQSDALISSGLADVGFNYINIDDGYFGGRFSNGALCIDSTKFPHGLKTIVDYLHSKNLKAGIYSDAGINTCGSIWNGQTGGVGGGLYNHEQQDLDMFLKTIGFDFIKVDYCGGMQLSLDERTTFSVLKTKIEDTGRDNVNYNIARWPFMGSWVTSVANSWRIAFDIDASWASITRIIDSNTYLAPYVSPGHYNDMDMLEVGRGLTAEEDKSHFSIWCLMSSPLVLGNDLTIMDQQTKDILTNAEVIAVNQDTTGLQGHLVSDNGAGLQVWAKNLNGKQSKERAVILFNRSAEPSPISVCWKELNLGGPASVRDLWSHTSLGKRDSDYTELVPSHGVVMLKITGEKQILQEIFEAEYAWINTYNLMQNCIMVPNQGKIATDIKCSGRARVEQLGNSPDNFIEFRDIYADSSKIYTLSFTYFCDENRNARISINGIDTLLTELSSGSTSNAKTSTYKVKLKKGKNIIRFSNDTGPLPDIDKIHLNLNEKTSFAGIDDTSKNKVHIYPNPSNSIFKINSDSPVKEVLVYSMTGVLIKKSSDDIISLAELKPGPFVLEVITQNGKTTVLVIKE